MTERFKNQVKPMLIVFLFLNLIFSINYLFKPTPATAQSVSSYDEVWTATEIAVTSPAPPGVWTTGGLALDTKYQLVSPSGLSSIDASRCYSTYASPLWFPNGGGDLVRNSTPHGFVTKWTVTGTLTQ